MINICVNKKLEEVLNNLEIDLKEYVPAYGGESAGLDLYSASEKDIIIYPSTYESISVTDKKILSSLIPTGLKINVPKGYVALIQERGSVTKTSLKVRAGVIDSGYTGEVFVNCVNIGSKIHKISKGTKLPFQIVVVKCDNQFNVISEEEYLDLTCDSNRKEGQVGSSD
jgi:dUTP pyrophosphatase